MNTFEPSKSRHTAHILYIFIITSLGPESHLAAAGLLFSGLVKTNEQQSILIICYLCLCINTWTAAEGRASLGSMIVWSMKNMDIWIVATLWNKDKVCPEIGERMSLKHELTKGHLTTSQNKTKPKGLKRHASCSVFRTSCLFWRITVK